jgi:hypothetical protein
MCNSRAKNGMFGVKRNRKTSKDFFSHTRITLSDKSSVLCTIVLFAKISCDIALQVSLDYSAPITPIFLNDRLSCPLTFNNQFREGQLQKFFQCVLQSVAAK